MKAADDVLERSGPPDFGAPNGTAAYRAEAPLNADESLFLQFILPLSFFTATLIATLRYLVGAPESALHTWPSRQASRPYADVNASHNQQAYSPGQACTLSRSVARLSRALHFQYHSRAGHSKVREQGSLVCIRCHGAGRCSPGHWRGRRGRCAVINSLSWHHPSLQLHLHMPV